MSRLAAPLALAAQPADTQNGTMKGSQGTRMAINLPTAYNIFSDNFHEKWTFLLILALLAPDPKVCTLTSVDSEKTQVVDLPQKEPEQATIPKH